MNFISLQNVFFSYTDVEEQQNKKYALNGVSLDVKKGEFLAIIGHNGCGKSTIAKHLNAMLLPDSGKVYVDGDDTSDEDKTFDIREKVGLVLQNPDNQLVASIVEEDVAFGPENLGVPPKEIRTRVDNALKAVGMYEYRKHAPHKLSGGQKQRVAIAGILAKKVFQSECPNIRVMHGDFDVLYPELENLRFQTIYLNFSDPWPKKRHEKRRLTHVKRLEGFSKLLTLDGELHIKTDNDSLYAFSLEQIPLSPFEMILNEENYIFDEENDVMSEYEKNFRSTGKSIHRIFLRKKQ